MTAILVDIASYGALATIGYGILKLLQGRYYGRNKPRKPNDGTKPDEDKE